MEESDKYLNNSSKTETLYEIKSSLKKSSKPRSNLTPDKLPLLNQETKWSNKSTLKRTRQNSSQSSQALKSTPTNKNLMKFNLEVAKTLSITELLEIHNGLLKSHVSGSSKEVDKYWQLIQKNIQIIENQLRTASQQSLDLKQITTEKEEWYNKAIDLEQELKDKKQQFEVYIQQKENTIQELTREIASLKSYNELSNKDEAGILNLKEEEISNLHLTIEEKNQLIKELKEKLYTQSQKRSQGGLPSRREMVIDESILQDINQKLHSIEANTEFLKNSFQSPLEKISMVSQQHSLSSKPLYSEKISAAYKNPKTTSESAILLKKTQATKTSLHTIRNLLNTETKNIPDLPKIYCETARDRNTLIIRSNSEENTEKTLRIIEGIERLKDITELTYKTINFKKIIVLGIPLFTQPEEVTEKILKDYDREIPIAVHKKIYREKSQIYHLVLDLDINYARHLTKQGRILIGFNSCKVADYRPIIRCSQCQRYGHTGNNCRFEAACAICAYNHTTTTCPNKEDPKKICCINCLNTKHDFPHRADSNKCPLFKLRFQSRKTFINVSAPHSTN